MMAMLLRIIIQITKRRKSRCFYGAMFGGVRGSQTEDSGGEAA
jgi:hypothetical protein